MWTSLLAASEVQAVLFFKGVVALAIGMLIWNTIEVGRNDAANLVNAVFGARILDRRRAVLLAGIGVVLGAATSSRVIETARTGIFDPTVLDLNQALAAYISVYIVNTVLLYGYSAFGMPVSTTACLVFELLGVSMALGGFGIVHWQTSITVVLAIVVSIFITGIIGFMVQRAVRGAIGDRGRHLATLLLHGGWAGGGMLAGLCYFLIVKGMQDLTFIQTFNRFFVDKFGMGVVLMTFWALFAILIHAALVLWREKAAYWLFSVLAVVGMIAMGFAFGQNDLANCASPGLAVWNLFRFEDVTTATKVDVSWWILWVCGFLLVVGMNTDSAQRVTRAEVNTGSMSHNVALYAPRWCIKLARVLMRFRGSAPVLAPPPSRSATGQRMHYDPLRACVILGVSACVIALASNLALPVSTTYVAFAAVMATGMADRIMQRGDADLKIARTIWVVFSWFASAIIAGVAAAGICRIIYHLAFPGVILCLIINLVIRYFLKKKADALESRTQTQAEERMYPERYAEYEG